MNDENADDWLAAPARMLQRTEPFPAGSPDPVALRAAVLRNARYRQVLRTPSARDVPAPGARVQQVAMRLAQGGRLGREVHTDTTQIFVVLAGNGLAFLDDAQFPIAAGSVWVVEPGTSHDVQALSASLALFTVYAPPHHPYGAGGLS